uniref:Uncharacterized protein n=1 Tax=Ursus americanus TaxID=9643 RepID=A0A452S7W4_URSAM
MSRRAVPGAQPCPARGRATWAPPAPPRQASPPQASVTTGTCLLTLGARPLMCLARACHAALHLGLPGRLHWHRGAHRPGLCARECAGDLGGEGEPGAAGCHLLLHPLAREPRPVLGIL